MATGSCKKGNLLTIFSDNTTQNITAADMRILINCIYDNFLDIVNVVDNLDTYIPYQILIFCGYYKNLSFFCFHR